MDFLDLCALSGSYEKKLATANLVLESQTLFVNLQIVY
jgi:hypothetical protein